VRNLYYLTLVLTLYPITLVQYKLPFTPISLLLFFFQSSSLSEPFYKHLFSRKQSSCHHL